MVQFLPQYNLGSELGAALGRGLGQSIFNRKQQQNDAAGFQALGYSPEIAQRLSLLNPKAQQIAMQNLQNQRFSESLQQTLGIGNEVGLPPEQMGPQQQQMTPQQQQEMALQQAGAQQQIQQQQRSQLSNEIQQQQEEKRARQRQQIIGKIPPGLTPDQAIHWVDMQQRKLERQEMMENKVSQQKIKQDIEQFKVMKKDVDTITAQYDAALDNKARLGAMIKLTEKGTGGALVRTLNAISKWGIGKINLNFLKTIEGKEAEALEKLSADFMKGATSATGGGRLTNTFLNLYQDTFPKLQMTQEGRLLVAYMVGKFQDIKIAEYKAMERVLEENHGIPPLDMNQKIRKYSAKEVDKLRSEIESIDLKGYDESVSRLLAARRANDINWLKPVLSDKTSMALKNEDVAAEEKRKLQEEGKAWFKQHPQYSEKFTH